ARPHTAYRRPLRMERPALRDRGHGRQPHRPRAGRASAPKRRGARRVRSRVRVGQRSGRGSEIPPLGRDARRATNAMRGSQLHIGCCGWALPQRQYFATFPVLEVQQTFYEPPRLVTLEKWRTASPPGFEFTLKAWQLITHEPFSPTYRRLKTPVPEAKRSNYGAFRPTDEVYAAWRATLACARALNARIIVFQCPAAFGPTAQHTGNLRRFFLSAGKEADD